MPDITVWPVSSDYCPTIVKNVIVITDTITVRNVAALSPCLRLHLPLVAYEN